MLLFRFLAFVCFVDVYDVCFGCVLGDLTFGLCLILVLYALLLVFGFVTFWLFCVLLVGFVLVMLFWLVLVALCVLVVFALWVLVGFRYLWLAYFVGIWVFWFCVIVVGLLFYVGLL